MPVSYTHLDVYKRQVWVGLADAEGAEARLHEFPGDRAQVRLLTVRAALERLEEALEGADA